MTAIRLMPPPPSASCSTRSATSTAASSRATARSTDDRHVADGYRQILTTPRRRARHLPVRRAEPAAVRRRRTRRSAATAGGAATTPTPTTRSARSTPTRRYRISGNRGDSVYFSRDRLQRAGARHLVGQGRGHRQRHRRRVRRRRRLHLRRSGRSPDVGRARSPATTRPTRSTGRRIDLGDRGATTSPSRSGTARDETAAALRASAAWLRTMFAIIPLDRRRAERRRALDRPRDHPAARTTSASPTRCATPTSAGRRATRRTPSAASCSRTTRRSSSRYRPPSCRFWNFVGVEPVHGDPQRRRRPLLGERHPGRAQRRRHGDDRGGAATARPPQRGVDGRLPARQPGLPVVPGRRGPGQARGPTGEGRRRPDEVS